MARELQKWRQTARAEINRSSRLERALKEERESCANRTALQQKPRECSWWAWWCEEPIVEMVESGEEVLIVRGCTD